MDDLKEGILKYLCVSSKETIKEIIHMIDEDSEFLNLEWFKDWKQEMRILFQK